jgi:uncharacterized protein (TIGR02996 family)
MKEHLRRAKEKLGDGDAPGALAALLEAWRARPLVELAELIERVPATVPPFANGKDWESAAKAKKPEALNRLLDELPRFGGWLPLQSWPRDPRFARRAVGWLAKSPVGSPTRRRFFGGLVDVLARQKDPAAAAALRSEDLLYKPVGYVGKKGLPAWNALAEQRVPAPAPLDAAERALVKAIGAALVPRKRSSGAKDPLADVYAHPDDDQARLVAADWLAERGDPRGEFITLQMTKPGSRREKQIEKQYAREWLGPIEPKILRQELVYRRGFPASGRYGTSKNLQGHAKHREWATFEELDVEPAAKFMAGAAPLLLGGACLGLRRIRGLEGRELDAIGRTSFDWESLHVRVDWTVPKIPLEELRLPKLRTLIIDGSRRYGSWKVVGRLPLQHLALVADDLDVGVMLTAVARAKELETIALLEGEGWDGERGRGLCWRLRLERTGGKRGWRLRVTAGTSGVTPRLVTALRTAPAGAFDEVIGDRSLSAEARAELERLS